LSGREAAALLTTAAAVLAAAPAALAAVPRVEAMVIARDSSRFGPRTVHAGAARVNACRVPAATPLAVLAAFDRAGGPPFRARGECSALYVFQIGRDRARGREGWVYKVGHRLGTTAAADPSGPFGTGRRLGGEQRVAWFWCVSAGRCQRTLEVVRPPRRVPAGRGVRVAVRAYDDNGRGVPARGVRVALGRTTAVTGADGTAVLIARGHGRQTLRAAGRGLVPAFPEPVVIG